MERTAVDNRYRILSLLGSGGMGHVYLARDEVLGRDVALKVLRESYAGSEEFVERFRREARNAASLYHPNIVSVYDMGEAEDGVPYIAMEYVAGGTLGERIAREGALDALEVAAIAIQIALALQAAHRRGVVHRDVKPHNVFLAGSPASLDTAPEGSPTGEVKVGDFGVARAVEATTTDEGLILGTARYLSPEQVQGEPVGPKSDLYSLGVVIYEMLTGRVPFDAGDPMAIATKHVSEPPPPPKEANPGVPEGMAAVVLRLLSKNPEDRHEDAAELIRDLGRVRAELPPDQAPPKPVEVPAGRGETREAPPAVLRDPDGKSQPMRDERTEPLPVAAVYGRGQKRRRVSRWVLAVASVVIFSILGAIGWNLTQGSAEPAPVTRLQEVALGPVDPPREASENRSGTGSADRSKAPGNPVPSGGAAEQSSGARQIDAVPTARVTQGDAAPAAPEETAAPAASQVTPSTSWPQEPDRRTVVRVKSNQSTTRSEKSSSTTKAESSRRIEKQD